MLKMHNPNVKSLYCAKHTTQFTCKPDVAGVCFFNNFLYFST